MKNTIKLLRQLESFWININTKQLFKGLSFYNFSREFSFFKNFTLSQTNSMSNRLLENKEAFFVGHEEDLR